MASKPKAKPLPVDDLVFDGGTQSRVAISEETVEDYVEVLDNADGKAWPFREPLDVFHDGNQYLVADGFHRGLACVRHGRASVPCRIHKGTAWDALIFGMGANNAHGLRPSRDDKRRKVELLLDSGRKLTQKEISAMSGVGLRTVSRIVSERKPGNAPLAHFGASGDPFDDDPFAARDGSDEELPPPPSTESDDTGGAGDEPTKTPEQLFREQKSRTVKTAEALVRAICDLNDLRNKPRKREELLARIYPVIEEVKDW